VLTTEEVLAVLTRRHQHLLKGQHLLDYHLLIRMESYLVADSFSLIANYRVAHLFNLVLSH
jgi:hypothetical protein